MNQNTEKLQQEIEFLTGILDDICDIEYCIDKEVCHAIKPYLAHKKKKTPVPKIKPWTKWKNIHGDDYILTLISGTYQLRSLCGMFRYGKGGKSPIDAFGGYFHRFTKVTEKEES